MLVDFKFYLFFYFLCLMISYPQNTFNTLVNHCIHLISTLNIPLRKERNFVFIFNTMYLYLHFNLRDKGPWSYFPKIATLDSHFQ